jgi:uncharacterized SAM-binding protein YcdF (DUF218 family)
LVAPGPQRRRGLPKEMPARLAENVRPMIDKLVTLAVSPLGTALLLLAAAGAAGWVGRSRRAPGMLGALAFGWLWLWSTPIASDALRDTLERESGPRLVEQVPAGDVIVVLGGSVHGPKPERRPYPDLVDASDRLWHAARLYRAGKAPRVLVSGGSGLAGVPPEAPVMRDVLVSLGVPREAILLESASTNTAQNAAYSRAVLGSGQHRVVLVTSALHMKRARRALERNGLQVLPAPTDFEVVPRRVELLRLLPAADALAGSARAFKEWVALAANR